MASDNGADEESMHIGKILNSRWQILQVLSRGGFGIVYSARDMRTNESVAVKVLRLGNISRPHCVQEFQDEARYLNLLANCNRVVDIHDSGADQQFVTGGNGVKIPMDLHFIVLEHADLTLSDLVVGDPAAWDWADRLSVFRDVVRGMHQLHRNAVVNRDLKSDNVLLFSTPKNQIVAKVADLGRARNLREPARFIPEAYAQPRGDRRFAAPELLWVLGSADAFSMRAADLYHIGSILFELATGFGITSYVIPEPIRIVMGNVGASEAERAERFAAFKPDLRDGYELAYEMFSQSVPTAIRQNLTTLFRQLTDIEPSARFPRIRGRRDHGESLEWLLRRIDVIALQLKRAEVEARRLEKRKVPA